MRDLITEGYLAEYRIVNAPMHADYSRVKIGSTGDYVRNQLRDVSRRSPQIIGDIVETYLKFTPGKRGVTFATDVETAEDIAAQYRSAGVPARMVHAGTPAQDRQTSIRLLETGELLQLVNVDLFGEGFDLPAIEVVSMARPTQSYALFYQQFGRALRPSPDKAFGWILDHVGNVMTHGLPDYGRTWSLDRREGKGDKPDANIIPTRVCPQCTAVFERFKTECPYCGHTYKPVNRSKPEFVDGDMQLLDPAVLAVMRAELQRIDAPSSSVADSLRRAGAPLAAVYGAAAAHDRRKDNQRNLREVMKVWGHMQGIGSEGQMKFYHRFGIDTLNAQMLGSPEAKVLTEKLMEDICLQLNQTNRSHQ